MKPTPVLILDSAGDIATPATAADLTPLAQDATLAALQTALLAAIGTPLHPNTKITTQTISLAAAVVDKLVPLGTLTTVETVVVKTLAGATASLKFGATTEAAIPLAQGETRDGMAVAALYLNSPGAAGGTITLELQGR
jgi:hypothetical protein